MDLDFVLPVYNERGNLRPLRDEIEEVLQKENLSGRVIFVNDGSQDGSADVIDALTDEFDNVSGLHFAENCGQSAAFAAGFEVVEAPFVVTMDADGQNDPADVPSMLEALEACDMVAGYRANRQEGWLRRIGSQVANTVRNWATGDDIIDTGCSLKVFRREVVKSLPMFEGMHRFLPTLARMRGYRVRQVPTNHRPRHKGETKYTLRGRLLTTVWDLLAVRWMQARTLDYEVTSTRNL